MNTKNTAIVIGVTLLVAAGGIFLTNAGGYLVNGKVPEPQVQEAEQTFGAVANPDIPSPWVKWGGTTEYRASGTWDTATSSVVCSIQNPAAATTTIDSIFGHVSNNSLGTQVLYVSTSTSNVGSSTPSLIADMALTNAVQTSIVWQAGVATTTPSDDMLHTDGTSNSPYICLLYTSPSPRD